MTIIDQLSATCPELGAAVRQDRLCTCDCVNVHPGGGVECDLIAATVGGNCDTCTRAADTDEVDLFGASETEDTSTNYATAAWSSWRVLTTETVEPGPIGGRLIVNARWRGYGVYARPAAIRTNGYVTHVGMITAVHHACVCPDWWDQVTTCRPWGQSVATSHWKSTLSHWVLTDVIELLEPVRHKVVGWMTRRTHYSVMKQMEQF